MIQQESAGLEIHKKEKKSNKILKKNNKNKEV